MRIELLVGKKIKEERKKQGLTQTELSKIIREKGGKIRREYISQIEQGQIKNVRIRTINQIAIGLDIPIYNLFSIKNIYSEDELFKPDQIIEMDKLRLRRIREFNIKIKLK